MSTIFVIENTPDGVNFHKFAKIDEFNKWIGECERHIEFISDSDRIPFDLTEMRENALIVIVGSVVVPQPETVVQKWKL